MHSGDGPSRQNASQSRDATKFPLILGVTGHRDPAEPALVEQQLEAVFREIDALAPNTPITVLCPLAEGSDQIFAETAFRVLAGRESGFELIAVLPFQIDDYRCDFRDAPEARQRFEALLQRADSVVELPPRSSDDFVETKVDGQRIRRIGSLPDVDASSLRAMHYDRLGRFMSVHAHAMVALWNGWNPPYERGRRTLQGGTASVVAYCRDGGATSRSDGVPLRKELPTILDNPRIPVLLVHTRRKRDLAAVPEVEDLSSELEHRFQLRMNSTISERTRAGARFGGRDVGTIFATEIRDSDSGASKMDSRSNMLRFEELVAQLERINRLPLTCVDNGGWLDESPIHRGSEVWRRVLRYLVSPIHGLARVLADSTRISMFQDFHTDTKALLFEKCRQANASALPLTPNRSQDDHALPRLFSMFRRADAVANFDVCVYSVTANIAVLVLAMALLAFQLYSSWSTWSFVLFYLVSLTFWIWFKRQLKLREQERAMARGLAELLRVQIAWRIAGLEELVVEHLAPRRVHAFGLMNRLLECATLYCVTNRLPESVDRSSLRAANEYWVRDQIKYINGNTMSRKRRKSSRRDQRKGFLMGIVLVVALIAFVVSMIDAFDKNLIEQVGLQSNTLTATLNFLVGASLVALLMTELRASIALEKEDVEAADGVRGLYETAAKQIDDAMFHHQLESGRRALLELGCAIIDEQAEWHLKHRDGAQVDIIG
jgi:hypothetical protein